MDTSRLEPIKLASWTGDSPEEFNAVKSAVALALQADAVGDQSACEQALADPKRLLGSAGTQTDDAAWTRSKLALSTTSSEASCH